MTSSVASLRGLGLKRKAKVENEQPHLTDLGNAQRFVKVHGDDLRFCAALGGWFVYDGRRWHRDETRQVESRAKRTVLALYGEAEKLGDSERKALVAHAQRSEAEPRLRALINLAPSEGIAVTAAIWDANPLLLNVLNGTLDLTTGTLHPHRREDYVTKLAPVEYQAGAQLEVWNRFLADVTGSDAGMQAFLQRFVGYSLTGLTVEEKLALLLGPEQSGKSTFIAAIETTMGDYAMTADFETFLKRPATGGARNDLARLAGARMVASVEVDDGKALAEGIVKTMTGGDRVTARLLYREAFEFVPRFKLWLAANHAPRVRDDDGAMWRRILRVPFEHRIPPEKRDPNVKATLRDPTVAGPAILEWAVRGCLEWQRVGLGVPKAVTVATDAYREDMDPLRDFIAERCVVAAEAWAPIEDLWRAYEDWSRSDRWALSRKDFGTRLTNRGWPADRRTGGTRIRRGIGLIANEGDRQ